MSTSQINRVMVLKLKGLSGESEFKDNFLNNFSAFRLLNNEVPIWGLEKVFTREGHIQLEDRLVKLYNDTDKSIPFADFKKCLNYMYFCTIKSKDSRGVTNSIIGNVKKNKDRIADVNELDHFLSVLEGASRKDKNKEKAETSTTKIMEKVSNTLKDMGFRNHAPYNIYLNTSERYSVVGNVHRQLTSWTECNAKRSESYQEEAEEIRKAKDSLSDNGSALFDFYTFCSSNNITKGFDKRMVCYLRDCIIPALWLDGKYPKNHFFYSNGDKTEERSYSLPESFFEYVKNHPELWNDSENVQDCYIIKNAYILEMFAVHGKHHQEAYYPFVEENDYHRYQYLLGDNYSKFKLEVEGSEDLDNVKVLGFVKGKEKELNYKNGKSVDRLIFKVKHGEKQESSFQVCLHEVYNDGSVNPGIYFKDLRVWYSKSKTASSYLFKFTRKGKEVSAIIKEPSIVFENGEFFIRLNMNILVDNVDDNIKEAYFYCNSAIGSVATERAKSLDLKKLQERYEKCKGTVLRCMSVDLGVRHPFAYAVGDITIGESVGSLNVIDSGLSSESDYNLQEYFSLSRSIKSLRRVFGISRSLISFSDKEIAPSKEINETIDLAKAFFKEKVKNKDISSRKVAVWEKFISSSNDEIWNSLKEVIVRNNSDLNLVKQDCSWLGNILYKYVDSTFKKLKSDRQFFFKLNTDKQRKKIHNEFRWIRIIEDFKKVKRSLSKLGLDEKEVGYPLTEMSNYYEGCKDNFLKMVASEIVDIAVKNKCNVIVTEDLTIDRSNFANDKQKNLMLSMWSPKRVLGAIENCAQMFGISLASVSESCTSQVHFESRKFGYRQGDSLFFEGDSNIESVHADVNAAKNILHRYSSRHADICQLYLEPLLSKNKEEKSSKRIFGMLTYQFGSVKNGKEFFKANFNKEDRFAYLHGDKWISLKEKNETVKRIKNSSLVCER